MLTDAKIRAAKPRDSVYELPAGGCPGLKLRVTPKGVRSWTLRYRTKYGDRRRITIGQYPAVKLKQARDMALELQSRVASGIDPNDQRAADRDALTMADLFGKKDDEGWFLSTHVKTAGRLGRAKTPHGIKTDRSYIKNHIRNRRSLLRKRVDEVTLKDLNAIKAAASPGAWRKVRNILRVAFKYAEDMGAIEYASNPVRRTTAQADKKVENYLTPDQRAALSDALDDAVAKGPRKEGGLSEANARAIRLLYLTGMRCGEVLDLRWQDVDWERGQLNLPTSKTGAKTVPLTRQALDFLRTERGQQIRVGRVCATDDGHRLGHLGRAWRSVREAAGLPKFRLHDLRHSWASDAISAGVSLKIIGRVLGHKSTATTDRYAHLHDDALRAGLDLAGDRIEKNSSGERR